jgi:hypothetical protein
MMAGVVHASTFWVLGSCSRFGSTFFVPAFRVRVTVRGPEKPTSRTAFGLRQRTTNFQVRPGGLNVEPRTSNLAPNLEHEPSTENVEA